MGADEEKKLSNLAVSLAMICLQDLILAMQTHRFCVYQLMVRYWPDAQPCHNSGEFKLEARNQSRKPGCDGLLPV